MKHLYPYFIAPLIALIFISLGPGGTALSSGGPSRDPHHRLVYRGGEVMSTTRTYAIFWLPSRYHFEPHGDDARYRHLIEQFLQDVGGTPFYNVLTQYSYSGRGKPVVNGPIRNSSTFGGSYLDTTPYPKAGTKADPLIDADFLDEVNHVAARNKWNTDINSLFFVFTGSGPFVCFSLLSGCRSRDLCAWHYGYPYGMRFAVVTDARDQRLCILHHSPNADVIAESAINMTSHELFESITDPSLCKGWVKHCGRYNNEIGDLCDWRFGTIHRDGSNVVLHDHKYLLQEEWSNRDGRCVLPSGTLPSTGSSSREPAGVLAGSIMVGLLLVLLAVIVLRSI